VGKEPVLVTFDLPVRVRAGVTYTIAAKITGPNSLYGSYAREVSAGGVKFVFATAASFGSASDNCTAVGGGQIPCIEFSLAGGAGAAVVGARSTCVLVMSPPRMHALPLSP
jgi:hypothetical protein